MKRNILIALVASAFLMVGCGAKPGKKETAACNNLVKLLFKEKADKAKAAFGKEDDAKKICGDLGKLVADSVTCAAEKGSLKDMEACAKKSVGTFIGAHMDKASKLAPLMMDKDIMGALGPAGMMLGGRRRHRRHRMRMKMQPKPMPTPTPTPTPAPKPTPTPAPTK